MIKKLKCLISVISICLLNNFSQAQVWSKVAKSVDKGLNDVHFISKSTGFVLSKGSILMSADSGKNWSPILTSYTNFTQIHFLDSKNGYVIGYNDLVLKTDDGGKNWSLKRTGSGDDDLFNLFCKGKDSVFVVGYNNLDANDSAQYLCKSYNGGNTWNRINLNTKKQVSSLNFRNKNNGIIGFLDGSIFESTNGFTSYTVNSSITNRLHDIKIIKDSVVIAVGNGGEILRSHNYGKSYKTITAVTSENLAQINFCNDSVGMICGDKGTILYSNNAGLSWKKMSTPTQLNFTGIHLLNPYMAWGVTYSVKGDSMDILKFEDKSCISKFVKLPRDTAICNKYTYETPFKTSGKNKPTWEINDALTNLYQKNDSVASIVGQHEGKFIMSFALQNCEETLLDTAILYVWRNPTLSVKDSIYCGQVNDRIMFSCFACNYLWSTNDNTTSLYVTKPGKYWVRVNNHCGTLSDTFTLSALPFLKLDLGKDTVICNQANLNIALNLNPGNFKWNDSDTNSYKTISKTGQYSVSFDNQCNHLSDTILVTKKNTPALDLGRDSIYCFSINHQVNLDTLKKHSLVKWDDGSNNFTKNFTQSGNYKVVVNNECGSVEDSISLFTETIPKADLGKDTIYCQNFIHSIVLKPNNINYQVLWWDNNTNVSRNFNEAGTYSVRIYNQCGEFKDTIIILQKSKPVVQLGKDTSLIKPFTIQLNARNEGSDFKWSVGATSPMITVNDFGTYWVKVNNYCGEDSDTINIYDKAGIKDVYGLTKIKVFPNPVKDGILNIQYLGGRFNVEVFDRWGNLVANKQGNFKANLNIEHHALGIYMVKITTEAHVVKVFKIVKQ